MSYSNKIKHYKSQIMQGTVSVLHRIVKLLEERTPQYSDVMKLQGCDDDDDDNSTMYLRSLVAETGISTSSKFHIYI